MEDCVQKRTAPGGESASLYGAESDITWCEIAVHLNEALFSSWNKSQI